MTNLKKKRLRDAQQAYVVALKGGHCERCGERHPPEIYDFHEPSHRPHTRVGKLYGCSLKRVVEEAMKCTLLCPTCHRYATVRG